jgi:hypothetical protein
MKDKTCKCPKCGYENKKQEFVHYENPTIKRPPSNDLDYRNLSWVNGDGSKGD